MQLVSKASALYSGAPSPSCIFSFETYFVICFSENIQASIADLQLLYVVDIASFHLSGYINSQNMPLGY
jgi:hypothetical protein